MRDVDRRLKKHTWRNIRVGPSRPSESARAGHPSRPARTSSPPPPARRGGPPAGLRPKSSGPGTGDRIAAISRRFGGGGIPPTIPPPPSPLGSRRTGPVSRARDSARGFTESPSRAEWRAALNKPPLLARDSAQRHRAHSRTRRRCAALFCPSSASAAAQARQASCRLGRAWPAPLPPLDRCSLCGRVCECLPAYAASECAPAGRLPLANSDGL